MQNKISLWLEAADEGEKLEGNINITAHLTGPGSYPATDP